MKKLVQVQEVQNEGFVSLLGERVLVYGLSFFYAGTLEGDNDTCILLKDASIVYETGPHGDKKFKDAQALPHPLYIQKSAIESFCKTDKV